MKSDYLIVHKKVLPDYFEKVVEARELLRRGTIREVSEAARTVGISRSTYYKYKDYVFMPSEGNACKKAVISLILSHEKGILSRVLNMLSALGANILTIMQNPPIGDRASVIISIDITGLETSVNGVLETLLTAEGVEKAGLLDIE